MDYAATVTMWFGIRTEAPGSADIGILLRAEADDRLLLTLDRDFWQIALQRRDPLLRCGVILFRIHPAVPTVLTPVVKRVLATGREWVGHVSAVSLDEIRMVRVPGRL